MKRIFRSIINCPVNGFQPQEASYTLQNYKIFVQMQNFESLDLDPAQFKLLSWIQDHYKTYNDLPTFKLLYDRAMDEGNEGIIVFLTDCCSTSPFFGSSFRQLLKDQIKICEKYRYQHILQKSINLESPADGLDYIMTETKKLKLRTGYDIEEIFKRTYSINSNENTLTKEGALPNDAIIIIAAYSNSLKSTFAIDTAYKASIGADILDQYEPRRPLRTLYICKDMSPRLLASYCKGLGYPIADADNWDLNLGDNFRFMCPQCIPEMEGFYFDTAKGMKMVDDVLNSFKPDILIIDSLLNCIKGKINDETIRAFYENIRSKVSSKQICTIILHHLRKASKEQQASGAAANGHDIYGSVVIYNFADAVLMTHTINCGDDKQKQISVKQDKPRDVFPNFTEFNFSSTQNTKYDYSNQKPIAQITFDLEYTRQETILDVVNSNAEKYYLLKCIDTKKPAEDIGRELKKSAKTIVRRFENLQKEGYIIIGGQKRWKTYTLTVKGKEFIMKVPTNNHNGDGAFKDMEIDSILAAI